MTIAERTAAFEAHYNENKNDYRLIPVLSDIQSFICEAMKASRSKNIAWAFNYYYERRFQKYYEYERLVPKDFHFNKVEVIDQRGVEKIMFSNNATLPIQSYSFSSDDLFVAKCKETPSKIKSEDIKKIVGYTYGDYDPALLVFLKTGEQIECSEVHFVDGYVYFRY